MTDKRNTPPFPTREQIVEFIRGSTEPVGKREIARAFHVRGADRARLNDLLRELRDEGELGRGPRRRFGLPGTLPPVTVVEVTGIDRDGDPVARPASWDGEGPPPTIRFAPERKGHAPGIGDRVLARLSANDDGSYTARTLKRLEAAPPKVLGIFEMVAGRGRIVPTNRRIRTEFVVPQGGEKTASRGDLVEARPLGGRSYGLPEAVVETVIGSATGPRAPSLIAIHSNDIPTEFTADVLHDAERAKPVPVRGREDLRDVPLVTIDGADARDFDDAVWAAPDDDPKNKGGWRLLVAIADVAWYVRPGAPLDRCAYERGNSVYFPDRVVPMLPEALSNGLCSLVAGEDRGCLVAKMRIDSQGHLIGHSFVRGVMRSVARLTYEQVEAARQGNPDDRTAPLIETVIAPLYGAFAALQGARQRRGTIDLDLPERKIVLDTEGNVAEIRPLERLDSHRLIEEFMISANVAAAETLERANAPCMFRVHDQPSLEKLEGLRETLASVGIKLAKGQVIKPELFQRILERAASMPEAHMINMSVLRSQAQAEYSPANIGHFGLALRHYAHFTSPIRRYSDLLVHRSLISVLGFGDDGLRPTDGELFPEFGRHISRTERRAVDAEREAVDRFTTVFLSDRIGAEFAARISGVHRAGLFLTLDETGADGFVPMSLLGPERFIFDEPARKIRARGSKTVFTLGDRIRVILEEADVTTGSLTFSIPSGRTGGPARQRPGGPGRKKPSKPGKPGGKPSKSGKPAKGGGKPGKKPGKKKAGRKARG